MLCRKKTKSKTAVLFFFIYFIVTIMSFIWHKIKNIALNSKNEMFINNNMIMYMYYVQNRTGTNKFADQHYCVKPGQNAFKVHFLSRITRKQTICICENKDADQLRGNREADQRLCFRYMDCNIPLLSKSKISSH